ncbi:MAG TPA: Smr/MutS family protein [Candidatus Sulfotelmatobacter sp.]|nr:Smr/MutS family protein [Candidatus Sulfotelmatobacter sp.]
MAEPPPARPRSRRLAADDLRLWRHVTRDIARLRGDAPPAPPDPAPPPPTPEPSPRTAQPPRRAGLRELQPGTVTDLDRATAERLRRGALAIDGKLDLHGLTQDEAHAALERFLSGSAARGRRCVLVITGKGLNDGDSDAGAGRARGVLRQAVPRWLNEPANRARILAVMPAQPKHGGAGALYVLLKRKR